MSVWVLMLGSFVLGLGAAGGVLLVREITFRRDVNRVAEGLDELLGGHAAFRIRVAHAGGARFLAEKMNLFAEHVQAQREQQLRHDEAHRRFVANVTHDLRTPITSIAGYADALRRGIGDDPERYVATIGDKAKQLARLTDDLFYMSRLDSGDLDLSAAPVDLCEAARRTLLGFEPQLRYAGTFVGLDLPEEQHRVTADEMALHRVLDNLISNTIAHAKGMTDLRVRLSAQNRRFRLEISDNGTGIQGDPDALFQRGQTGTGGGGTGLGLAIAYDLALRMGMDLHAESETGRGASFVLEGPLAPDEDDVVGTAT